MSAGSSEEWTPWRDRVIQPDQMKTTAAAASMGLSVCMAASITPD